MRPASTPLALRLTATCNLARDMHRLATTCTGGWHKTRRNWPSLATRGSRHQHATCWHSCTCHCSTCRHPAIRQPATCNLHLTLLMIPCSLTTPAAPYTALVVQPDKLVAPATSWHAPRRHPDIFQHTTQQHLKAHCNLASINSRLSTTLYTLPYMGGQRQNFAGSTTVPTGTHRRKGPNSRGLGLGYNPPHQPVSDLSHKPLRLRAPRLLPCLDPFHAHH